MPRSHAEAHSDATHHIGPCDEPCRAGLSAHLHRETYLRGRMGTSERGPLGLGVVFIGPQAGPSPAYVRRQYRRHRELFGPSSAGMRPHHRKKLSPALKKQTILVASGRAPRNAKGKFVKRRKGR